MGHSLIFLNLGCEHKQEEEIDTVMHCDWKTNQTNYWHNSVYSCKVNNKDHCKNFGNAQKAKPIRNEVSLFYF